MRKKRNKAIVSVLLVALAVSLAYAPWADARRGRHSGAYSGLGALTAGGIVSSVSEAIAPSGKSKNSRSGLDPHDRDSESRPDGNPNYCRSQVPFPRVPAPIVFTGKVTRVSDGDTIWVQPDSTGKTGKPERVKIRFSYIDAPESSQMGGKQATEALRAMALHKNVVVESFGSDRYGRLTAKVSVGGKDLLLELLREGLVWHYCYYAVREQSPADFASYRDAQSQAYAQKLGVWADPLSQAPWNYRHSKKK